MKTMMMMMKMRWRSEGRWQEVELSRMLHLQQPQPISSLLCHLFSLQVFSSQPRPPRDPWTLHPRLRPPLQKAPPPRQTHRPRPLYPSLRPAPPLRYDLQSLINRCDWIMRWLIVGRAWGFIQCDYWLLIDLCCYCAAGSDWAAERVRGQRRTQTRFLLQLA